MIEMIRIFTSTNTRKFDLYCRVLRLVHHLSQRQEKISIGVDFLAVTTADG